MSSLCLRLLRACCCRALLMTASLALGTAHAQPTSVTGPIEDPIEDPIEGPSAFAQATEAFEAGDYRRAIDLFSAAIDGGAEGPAAPYNLGVSLYRLGDYTQAAERFRLLGAEFPALRELADYNLGLALLALNQPEGARAAWMRAALSADPAIADLARAGLGRLPAGRPAAARTAWIRFLDLGLGHDDNVALREDTSLPAGQTSDSPFAEIYGYASGPISARTPLLLDLSGYLVRYPDAGRFDQNSLRVATRYRRAGALWMFDVGPHFSYTTLDGAGFEQQLGFELRGVRRLGDRQTLELRVGHDRIDAPEAVYAFVEGSRQRLRAAWEQRADRVRWRLRYDLERNDRDGANVTADRQRFAAEARRQLGADWYLDLGLVYRISRFTDLAEPRKETLREFFATTRRTLPADWLLSIDYRYSDNDATDSFFNYARQRFTIGASRLF